MKALFDAIFVHYNATALGAALPLHNTEAPAETPFPYTVLQLVVGSPEDFATREHFTEDWLIQFNLFDNAPDMSALLEAYATLISAFDFAGLTIAGYDFKSCVRPPGSTLQTKVEKVWQINVTYRVKARVL